MAASPADKVESIRRELTNLFLESAYGSSEQHVLSGSIGRRNIVKSFEARADEADVKARALMLAATTIWTMESLMDDQTVIRKAAELDLLVNYGDGAEGSKRSLAEARVSKSRVARALVKRDHIKKPRPPISSTSSYLPLGRATKLWASASFMVQQYGVFLNASLLIRYEALGLKRSEASRFLTDLTRELRMRLRERSGGESEVDLHWLYVHERSVRYGLQTRLVLHLPLNPAESFHWIENGFLANRGITKRQGALKNRVCRIGLQDHIRLVRAVCRATEPTAAGRAFLNAIGVDDRLRGELGELDGAFGQLCGVSRQIDTAAQGVDAELLPIINPTKERSDWPYLLSGWEEAEYRYRYRLKLELQADEHLLEREFAGSSKYESELRRFRKGFNRGLSTREKQRPGLALNNF